MPLSPTAAQSESSRRNGALSTGPATEAGKARLAERATRHGLRGGTFHLLPGEDTAEFERLCHDLALRHGPIGAAEQRWVEELAFALWRLRRVGALEAEALDGAEPESGHTEPEPRPSLATLTRYRARIERDIRLAEAQLDALRQRRPRATGSLAGASAAQLRWLADRREAMGAALPAPGAPVSAPAHAEPEPVPAPPPANRAARRRLAALQRLAGRRSAATG